jgi:hypothetical protein
MLRRIGLEGLNVGGLEDVVGDAVFVRFGGLVGIENPSVVNDKLKAGDGQRKGANKAGGWSRQMR